MRLGVFLPNWVGDVVMATPALRALRKLVGTEGQLVGIMRPYVAEVLAGTTWLDRADDLRQVGESVWAAESGRLSRVAGRATRPGRVVDQFDAHGLDGVAKRCATSGSAIATKGGRCC